MCKVNFVMHLHFLVLFLFMIFKKIFIDFSFGQAGSSLLCGLSLVAELGPLFLAVVQAAHCSGFSCGAQGLGAGASVAAAPGL